MEGDNGGPGPATTKKRRANVGKACNNCRRRKSRCDGQQPECKTCQIYNDECTWGDQEDGRKPASRQYVNTLKNRIATLEAYIKEKGQDLPSPGAEPIDGHGAKAEEDAEEDDQGLNGLSTTMLHLQMGEAGEQVHYYGPTSAFAHSSRDPPISASPVEYKLGEYMNRPHDYRRYLPESITLTQTQHTVILDRFFRFFASWGLRAMPDLFHQDMIRTVMLPPHSPLARFTHYSPFLHNIMLAIALMWADEEDLRETSTRAIFASKAETYLAVEIARPTLATIQGLALKSSYHSTLGDHTGGWAYFGMADRASLSLGLNLSCTALVEGGRMSKSEMIMRRNAFWCIFVQEQCWSVYIGRPHEGQAYSTPLPTVDDALDEMPWRWDNLDSPDNHLPPQPCMFSTAFVETTKLTLIMQRVMTTLYSIKSDVFKLQKDSTITDLGVALDSWAEQLPPALIITGHTMKNALPHIIMLQLAKEWCTILIYRPYYRPVAQMTGAGRTSSSSESLLNLAVRRCDRSAARINSLLQTYHQRFGLRYTPPTLFNIAFTAGTTHLLSAVRHHGAKVKNDALASARECVGFLHSVAESWPAAGHKADILDQLVSEYHPPEATPAPTPLAPLPTSQTPIQQTQPMNILPPTGTTNSFGSSSLSPTFPMSWPVDPMPAQQLNSYGTDQPSFNNFDQHGNDQFLFSLLNHITLPPQATSPNDYVFMPPTDWSPAQSIGQIMAPAAAPAAQQFPTMPFYNPAQAMGPTSSQHDRRPSSATETERSPNVPSMNQMQWNGYFGSG